MPHPALDHVTAALARPDPDDLLERLDEDLAVADDPVAVPVGPASSSAVNCNRFGCRANVDAQVGNTSVNCHRFGCNARR